MYVEGQKVKIIGKKSAGRLGNFDLEVGDIATVISGDTGNNSLYVKKCEDTYSWFVGLEDLEPAAPPSRKDMESLL